MCGRYFSHGVSWEEYRSSLDFQVPPDMPDLRPAYNIAPTQTAPIFRYEGDKLVAAPAMWGLVPHWWKKPLSEKRFSTFNARSEKGASAASFRTAFKKRHCLIPASGFYEWKGPKGQKQPYAIGLQNRRWFCFAGLWDRATIEEHSVDGETVEERVIDSFTILTTAPNDMMKDIHNRMPVILNPGDYKVWLEPENDNGTALLKPFPGDLMHAWPVGKAVGNSRNQGRELIAEIDMSSRL